MSDQNCIFCKIINKQIPSNIVAENDELIVIKDIAPKAPVHLLIIPRIHIKDVASLDSSHIDLAGKMVLMAQGLSKQLSGSKAFRLMINNGADAGQAVFHLHMHFLSGKRMLD
ncbi:MAG: histidine triad nucleotide-binding protein [Candidatus Babeliales bacterium]|nr:histidine triad nucleotide-binding protein [Candidatus Babeliales bacterium]